MSYGLNISASGVLTSMYRQDVMANNLANLGTVGFKPDMAYAKQRDAARTEDNLPSLPSNVLLERLGAGALLAPNRIDQSQGELHTTGNPLDAAIRGPGFFVLQAPNSEANNAGEAIRLTRDGRLALDASGKLVQSTSGLPVFDTANRPIVLNKSGGVISIRENGTVTQNGRVMARLQVSEIPDPTRMRKVGESLYEPDEAQAAAMKPSRASIVSGSLEQSGVDPIKSIMGVTSASSDVASNTRMMQLHDELMGRAINTFGRVS